MKRAFVLILAVVAVSSFKFEEPEPYDMHVVVPSIHPSDRITGGSAIPITDAPWQIGLLIGGSGWCGGSLIAPTWVLTAAHCVDSNTADQFIVYLGSATKRQGTQRVPTEKIIHSGWDRSTLLNDIALLRIPAVSLSSTIQTVALPSSSTYSVAAGTLCTATGWGRTSDSIFSSPSALQSVNLEVISNTKCGLTYGSIITSSNVCVATTGGTSICQGDSGGPLVDASTKVLVGLSSFVSSAGCLSGKPAGFTRISSFRSWIQQNTGV